MTHQGPPPSPADLPAVPAARSPIGSPAGSPAEPPSHVPPEPPREDLAEKAIRRAPPWLVSAVVHMVGLILLGLLLLPSRSDSHISLEAQIYAEQLGDQLDFDTPLAGDEQAENKEPLLTPENLPEVENPFAAPPKMEITAAGGMATTAIDAPQIGWALSGRTEGMKKSLGRRYGATAATEASVQLGLKWLARNQNKRTGAWSLTGPYRDGSGTANDSAATAMALLAFLGNGHTHQGSSIYRDNVHRGLKWLLAQQDKDGCFFRGDIAGHRFYTHAMGTIVVCEALAMTRDQSLRPPARRAVQYLVECQAPPGGWRYSPRQDSDTSVTGWVVMALQSARMAGIEVPYDCLRQVERFLDSVALEGGSRYVYQNGWPVTPSMTAEALLCRQYLGWARDDKRLVKGVEWLTEPENLINYQTAQNVYYWYYAAQVMHHMEGEPWQKWNKVMSREVPKHQVAKGAEAGSWDPSNQSAFDSSGGRLYVTCLSIYMLEVYYRHMPIYSSVYKK